MSILGIISVIFILCLVIFFRFNYNIYMQEADIFTIFPSILIIK